MTSATDIPRNDAIEWSGTRYGLLPTVSDEAERLATAGEAIVPALLHALADPERFVTAHVLLTRISGVSYETFPTWNGIQVTPTADGATEIDAEQRQGLARRWQLWYREEPPPDSLPEVTGP
jgi:hypothetical protein